MATFTGMRQALGHRGSRYRRPSVVQGWRVLLMGAGVVQDEVRGELPRHSSGSKPLTRSSPASPASLCVLLRRDTGTSSTASLPPKSATAAAIRASSV